MESVLVLSWMRDVKLLSQKSALCHPCSNLPQIGGQQRNLSSRGLIHPGITLRLQWCNSIDTNGAPAMHSWSKAAGSRSLIYLCEK